VVSLFERLGQPSPVKAKIHKDDPAQRLLDWLINRWTEPTITARNVCQFGPRPYRKLKDVINSAEILTRQGWLVPTKTRRHEWQVVRRPIVRPTITT
jgi:hypothetical protein